MKLTENNVTRKMLEVIRENESNSLVNVTKEEINKAESDLKKATNDNQAKIMSFKVYSEEKNAIIVASLPNAGDVTIRFIYNEPDGIYMNASNANLTPTNLKILSGLTGFYTEFVGEWSEKFNDEYSD
jgi:hypothetical protein